MDEGFTAEDMEAGDIRLIATPGFLWSLIIKCLSGGDIMNEGGMLEGIVPVEFGKASVNKYGTDPI